MISNSSLISRAMLAIAILVTSSSFASAQSEDLARYFFKCLDAKGRVIERNDAIGPNRVFTLVCCIRDLRPTHPGVFGAFLDVTFDPALAIPIGGMTFRRASFQYCKRELLAMESSTKSVALKIVSHSHL